ELHDELGALLTAAKLDLARLKSRIGTSGPEVKERLQHLGATLNQVIALKRRIIEDLRPSALANLGLATALEILAREFSERAGLAVHAQVDEVHLSDAAQLAVYRLVQESLTNIGKYALAHQVGVRVQQQGAQVTVRVHDDGVGFDPTTLGHGGHGLAGMRQRIEALGGQWQVQSAPGQGTTVHAWLPASG
ncbi:MAG: sensor histidine kinase, partial [Giesbergeria sp.]